MRSKILIADDSGVNLSIMHDILFDEGYDVDAALNGKIAIEQALLNIPDLILMDWQMPVMDGIQALEALKANEKTKNVPVIMVTGIATTAEHLQEAFQKGAIDFIKKPFEKIELLSRVKAYLSLVGYFKLTIEHKNQEISASMLQLSQLTGLQEQISKKLNQLKSDFPKMESQINDVLSSVDAQLSNVAWKRYEENFRELNPLFYKKFLEAHPNISPAEIRLCTLLRLSMSTKEIADFIHQEETSIRISRSRLRKKLGLSGSDNLVAYLIKF